MAEGSRRYEIIQPIGRGGMGTIYLARMEASRGFSKQVALKIATPSEANDEALSRLRDEARVLGLLRHRAIVGVDGLVRLDGKWTVVMEYVDGLNLSALVQGSGKLPLGVALEIVAEVAAALHAAFQATDPAGNQLKLQHRDIKPANILLTAQGEVKVLDFGIARAEFDARESITLDHHYGSSGYMAPERFDFMGHERSDIYSLGVVLFALVTGRKLTKASTHPERHHAQVQRALMLVSDRAPVARLLGQMLAYDPEERPTPREVHRLCLQLRPADGETLHDWAEHKVPALLARHRQAMELGAYEPGQVLTERTEVTPAGMERTDPSLVPLPQGEAQRGHDRTRTGGVRRVLGASLVLLFVVVAAVGLAWMMWMGPASTSHMDDHAGIRSTPEPPTPDMAAPESAPESAPGSVEAANPATPGHGSGTAPTEQPEQPTTKLADAEPAATPGSMVKVSGDATRVVLTRGSRQYQVPRWVPAGDYRIVATFAGSEPLRVGEIEVPASGTVAISCSALFVGCEVR